MGFHGPSPSPLNRTNVINATGNESIEPRHWIPLDTNGTLKTLNLQQVNVDLPEIQASGINTSQASTTQIKTIILLIKARTYPLSHNMLRLYANKRIQKQTLINLKPVQPRRQPSSWKKVLHEKDLIGNSYRNKIETNPAKTL